MELATLASTGAKGVMVTLLAPHPARSKGARRRAPLDLVEGKDGLVRPGWAYRNQNLMDYYDTEWGVPIVEDDKMFRLLSLLILQAGLTWGTTLGNAQALDEAFEEFDPLVVAGFTEEDEGRLLKDERLIRNKRKVRAILSNAKVMATMDGHVSLAELVWAHRPSHTPIPYGSADVPLESEESTALAKALRRVGFTFVGPRTCYSLMQGAGVVDTNLVGAHRRGCSGLWNEDGSAARHLPIENGDMLAREIAAS